MASPAAKLVTRWVCRAFGRVALLHRWWHTAVRIHASTRRVLKALYAVLQAAKSIPELGPDIPWQLGGRDACRTLERSQAVLEA